MPRTRKAAKRTLLLSVIMSSPGPLVVGLSLFIGNSSTQMADFIRRTSEFIAIVMSFLIYKIAENENFRDEYKSERLERASNLAVGILMCLGGTIMTVLALAAHSTDKGNVIPGLVIAVLSASGNAVFSLVHRIFKGLQEIEIYHSARFDGAGRRILIASLDVGKTRFIGGNAYFFQRSSDLVVAYKHNAVVSVADHIQCL